jgi:hypothetical protein
MLYEIMSYGIWPDNLATIKKRIRKIFSHYFLKRINRIRGMCKKASAPNSQEVGF